jgi:hypothetical protein
MAMMVPIPLANGDSMKIYLSKVNNFEQVVLFWFLKCVQVSWYI